MLHFMYIGAWIVDFVSTQGFAQCSLTRPPRLASYQRPACSPPALEWFGSIPPKRRHRQFGRVTPEVAFGLPRLGTVIKQRQKRMGWAFRETAAPHPPFLENGD